MSADTTDTDEIVQIEYSHDGYPVDEFEHIDLSNLDFDDFDYWLYMPMQCSTESTIENLYAWLKTDPELNVRNSKKCINSRTFTRPKKRSTWMSFESIFEGLPPSGSNILKSQNLDLTHIEDVDKYSPVTTSGEESVPPMLMLSSKAAKNILADESIILSGQESMEVFLNVSQSKGIDSFINLGEPEFSDPLMSTSQPSILYTSIISSMNESIFTQSDAPITAKNTICKIVQQSNNVEKIPTSCANETFIMPQNDTITVNTTYCTNSLNNTFYKETVQSDRDLNATYDTETSNDKNLAQFQTNANSNVMLLNTAYVPSFKNTEKGNTSVLNNTYEPTQTNKANLNITCEIPSNEAKSTVLLETSAEDALDMSFKVPIYSQSTPINPNILNATSKSAVKHLDQPRQTLHSMLKAPTSLRRELLAEIQRGEYKLHSTYNHDASNPSSRDARENVHLLHNENGRNETDVVLEDKYHTYKKTEFKNPNKCNIALPIQKESQDRRFYTFTKKYNNFVEKTEKAENVEYFKAPSNRDGTFCKPLSKAQKKNLHTPRVLSKLPQFLQKSNPNIVSNSLKTAGLPGWTSISRLGYMKGSQPNIVQNVEKLLPNKLHPFGKLKSGSEQQLLEVNVNRTEFQTGGTSGSTESIESTQSAQSAPDLDDRLSVCSDSTHNSCTRRTMNIEQLHQLVRMQEESLKQDSVPKIDKVLENTWIEGKTDLPSPILKNGTEFCEIDKNSSLSTDLCIKCSSPITSPIGSSHILNYDGSAEGNIAKDKNEVAVIGKKEAPNQIVPKIENKTRLRQPINWNTGSKSSAVISGIPRPASRIPALRFAKPNAKTAQSQVPDLRKGYM